ncbi:MAG: TMEM165/GDT1 family protein [Actinomycetota bacterium]
MWWKAFAAAFGLLFIAELGDKTQLVILALAGRHGWSAIFAGHRWPSSCSTPWP